MIPVEEGKTSSAGTPRTFAASRQTHSHPVMPERPVAQFALPELTMTARTRPRVLANDARPTVTGAATTRFVVNNAAAVAPSVTSGKARSGRPLTLMPAVRAAKENPRGTRIFSGEF